MLTRARTSMVESSRRVPPPTGFVGRVDERRRLELRLRRPPPLGVVCLHGAPGMGKTALARSLVASAEGRGLRTYWLPGEQLAPNPAALRRALRELGREDDWRGLGRSPALDVVVLDAFERLAPFSQWIFSNDFRLAGPNLLVVLTSRTQLDPGTVAVLDGYELETIPVGPLSTEACGELLRQRGVSPDATERVMTLTHGHPLTVRTLLSRPDFRAALETLERLPRDVIGVLFAEICRDADTGPDRDALYALAVADTLDESMLSRMLDQPGHALYDALRALPYVTETSKGLVPHDLFREVIERALDDRDRQRRHELARSCAAELVRRMPGRTLEEQRELLLRGLYASRHLPSIRERMELEELSGTELSVATPEDVSWVRTRMEEAYGAPAVVCFDAWYRQQPTRLFVFRDGDVEPLAAVFYALVESLPPEIQATDPLARDVMGWWRDAFGDASVGFSRFYVARDGDRRGLSTIHVSWPLYACLCEPLPRRTLVLTSEEDRLLTPPTASAALLSPLDAPRFRSGDVALRLWCVDLGAVPGTPGTPGEALRGHVYPTMLRRMVGLEGEPEPEQPTDELVTSGAPSVRLSDVRDALRYLHQPHRLAGTRLLEPLRPAQHPSPDEALVTLLTDEIDEMRRSGAEDTELGEVLEATYVRPSTKQYAAAVALGLPWGTYRHRLRRALAELTRRLQVRLARTATEANDGGQGPAVSEARRNSPGPSVES